MIRPILPPVLPPLTPITVKETAAEIVLQIVTYAAILGIFTLAAWIMLRHSKKDRDQYLYTNHHDAIISVETFEAAQVLLESRRHHYYG
ncbi:MAG: recombinase family protein, partial [Clostridia bacterium]|nr:recombinase family protein [Clostridia bacterium]